MELSYEDYQKYHLKKLIFVFNDNSDYEGTLAGFRQDEKGEISTLLLQEGVAPILLENVKNILMVN